MQIPNKNYLYQQKLPLLSNQQPLQNTLTKPVLNINQSSQQPLRQRVQISSYSWNHQPKNPDLATKANEKRRNESCRSTNCLEHFVECKYSFVYFVKIENYVSEYCKKGIACCDSILSLSQTWFIRQL